MIAELVSKINESQNSDIELTEQTLKKLIYYCPYFDHAYEKLAELFRNQGLFEKEEAIRLELEKKVPGIASNRFALGRLCQMRSDLVGTMKWFDMGLNSPISCNKDRMLPYGTVSEARLLHDIAQIRWLVDNRVIAASYANLLPYYEQALTQMPADLAVWSLPLDILLEISPFYRRCINLYEQRDVSEFFSSHVNWEDINVRMSSDNISDRVIVIDNFLSDEAYSYLWNFSLASTIWHNDAQLGKGYIGAYRHNGFSTNPIERLGREIQNRIAILKQHELSQIWAYRNVEGMTGIGTHADDSILNVNIWLTPESANKNDETGGLLVYNKGAPLAWSFSDYNADLRKISSYLSGAKSRVIKYRQNRAVIFDSRLFHASHNPMFGEAFDEMRLNVTYLYGQRLKS